MEVWRLRDELARGDNTTRERVTYLFGRSGAGFKPARTQPYATRNTSGGGGVANSSWLYVCRSQCVSNDADHAADEWQPGRRLSRGSVGNETDSWFQILGTTVRTQDTGRFEILIVTPRSSVLSLFSGGWCCGVGRPRCLFLSTRSTLKRGRVGTPLN